MADTREFCVVITRPEAQARQWESVLVEHGFHTTALNLLEIVPVSTEEKIRAIKNKILDFDLYRKAIFVSQNAVAIGMQWLEDYWPQLPIGIDFFAVGATTAKKLSEYGVVVTDLAMTGGMTSEDLLRAPGLQQVSEEKIIIFRGCGGRGHMGDELRNRGAWVDYCELYERCIPDIAAQQLQQLEGKMIAHNQRYILSVHSGESLDNLLQLLEQTNFLPEAKSLIARAPLLVPSQRIAANAKNAGFTTIIAAENATDIAMTKALMHYVTTQ